MRNVGGELANLLEGTIQARHHMIERFNQPVQFVAGAARGNLHVEIGMRDALRGVGHRIHRMERAAGQKPSQQAAQHDDQRHPGEVIPGKTFDHLVVVIESAADGQVILVAVVIHPQAGADHIRKAGGVCTHANGGLAGLQNGANLRRRIDAEGIVDFRMLERVTLGIGQHVDALHAADGEAFVRILLVENPIRSLGAGA